MTLLISVFFFNMQMIKKQYPEDSYRLNTFEIKFSSVKDSDDPGIGIQVLDPEQLKEKGWNYFIENDRDDNMVYT